MARAATAALAGSKYYIANGLAMSMMFPMAVKAVMELRIPDLLAKAEGGKPLTAPQILAKLPTKSTPGPHSFSNLRRLMRPLVQAGVFSETLNEERQPAYGLTEISEWCVTENELGVVPYYELFFAHQCQTAFFRLHETILDEKKTPFEAEWGMTFYDYAKTHPQFGVMFDKAMTGLTRPELKSVVDMLEQSGWLEGVKTFVDVGGGGQGHVVGQVVAHNPHIQGINFDQPEVIERAPEVNGVRHVGGDFFKAIPSGDAMFIKFILHNYDDDTCIRILTRCSEALPNGGKVIIAENVLSQSDKSHKGPFTVGMDLIMLATFKGGQERTVAEYQKILSAAGFSKFCMLHSLAGLDLIQGIKE